MIAPDQKMLCSTNRVWRAQARNFSVYEAVAKPVFSKILGEIEEAGTYKKERVIVSKQNPHSITVTGKEKPSINFCANNYLGLADNERLVNAAINQMKTHGLGLASVRFICGTQDIHKQLESTISKFHGTEDTILYSSCFDANGGLFEGILTSEDAIITDSLNHASIIDGIRLCKAERLVFEHMDMKDLEAKLIQAQGRRLRLISTDGVFSMDGHIAPLKEIVALAKKYNALIHVDDAHATGFLGPNGRGSGEFHGVMRDIDIVTSTFGKALGGSSGGYVTSRKEIVDLLRQRSRTYLFSNTLAPAIVGATVEMFKMMDESPDLRNKLWENTKYFRRRMTEEGFQIPAGEHAIVPIMLGDARLTGEFAQKMLAHDIYVIGFSFPVVPKGKARIRVQVSAGHSRDDLDKAIAAFAHVGKELGVIKK